MFLFSEVVCIIADDARCTVVGRTPDMSRLVLVTARCARVCVDNNSEGAPEATINFL